MGHGVDGRRMRALLQGRMRMRDVHVRISAAC
jgi:hypothetical protein